MLVEFIQKCWKGVLSIVGILAVITALTGFYSTLATSADIAKIREENKTAIGELRKSMQLDRNLNRLDSVNDNLMKAKIQQRDRPNDKTITEDIQTLQQEKIRLQQQIQGR